MLFINKNYPINLKNSNKSKNCIQQRTRISDQKQLMFHIECGDEQLGRGGRTPGHGQHRQHIPHDALQWDDNGQRWQHDNGQNAIAEHGHDDGQVNGRPDRHHGQQCVHAQTAQDAEAVDVVEVDFAHQEQQRPEGHAED